MTNSVLILLMVVGLGVSMAPVAGGAAAQGDDKHPIVVLDTTAGEITLELDAEKAPVTVENFL